MLSHRFRWVFCQLEVLRHCFPANLRRTLEELPKSLDETYKRILSEINNANWVHAYRLLQCLTVALRPLRVEELAEVLAFDLTTGRIPILNPNWRWEDQEEAVLSACSSLVSIIIDDDSRVVQFSHFSVKEFLVSTRLESCKEEVSQFHIPIEPSHAILAQACIGVLLYLDDRTDKDSVKIIPLYRYSSEHWVAHAQFGNVEFQIKDALDYFFDMDNPHFSALVRIEHPRDFLRVSLSEVPTGVPRPAAPLYFAASSGFHGLVGRLIIKHPQQVNQLGGLHGTPLHASVRKAHLEVSRLLFAHSADINSRCADNWTPLHIASTSADGHKIVMWLLDHGADVRSQKDDASTPLHLAASRGHLETCRTLLERNAKVNTRNNNGSTPLLEALNTRRKNFDVVQLLLDHNADVQVHDNKGNTPLHLAAESGRLEIARVLLKSNAEVNSRNDDGYTPLFLALKKGYADVALLLLDHDADVLVHDNSGNTPLQYAARSGFLEVARTLLERNADVNSPNYHRSTPLLLASELGHTDIVQLLLDHNADVDVRDADGDSPLHCAAHGGQLEVARILLKLNVEVNSRNNMELTPLHRASMSSEEGCAGVVQLLLDCGADVQACNVNGDTASEVARGPEQQEIVRLLSHHAAE
jgi:ankyrin repeat protein